jgi:hypothetical protein
MHHVPGPSGYSVLIIARSSTCYSIVRSSRYESCGRVQVLFMLTQLAPVPQFFQERVINNAPPQPSRTMKLRYIRIAPEPARGNVFSYIMEAIRRAQTKTERTKFINERRKGSSQPRNKRGALGGQGVKERATDDGRWWWWWHEYSNGDNLNLKGASGGGTIDTRFLPLLDQFIALSTSLSP